MSKPQSLNDCLALLAHHAPHLPLDNPRVIAGMGQFNTVLCLDDSVIARFPKSAHAARDLAHELRILPRLQGRLPLPIPAPMTSAQDSQGLPLFMAYPMLPGQPLLRGKYDKLRADTRTIESIARDLAGFLQVLRDIPPAELGLQTTAPSPRDEWAKLYADFQSQLYPFMRDSARREVSRDFDLALADKDLWRMRACVTHGDIGTGNILCQQGRVSGVIDWSFCRFGDPAQDLGALLASYGEAFIARVCRHYPALGGSLARARFFRRQYALIHALYALRDDDQAEFEDGIAAYR